MTPSDRMSEQELQVILARCNTIAAKASDEPDPGPEAERRE